MRIPGSSGWLAVAVGLLLAVQALTTRGIVASQDGPEPDATATQDVAAATRAWADAFNSRDPARITALYAADAVFWGTTSATIRATPAEIAEYFKDSKARPDVRVALGRQHVRVFGDVAINSGDYVFTDVRDGTRVTNPSRFTFVYRKRGSQWLIVDHHSSRRPEP